MVAVQESSKLVFKLVHTSIAYSIQYPFSLHEDRIQNKTYRQNHFCIVSYIHWSSKFVKGEHSYKTPRLTYSVSRQGNRLGERPRGQEEMRRYG